MLKEKILYIQTHYRQIYSEISYHLHNIEHRVNRLKAYRKNLVEQMSKKVKELPRDNFGVRQHLKYADLYSSEDSCLTLSYEDVLIVREELAPLILTYGDEASVIRFDALMYGIIKKYMESPVFQIFPKFRHSQI